MIISISISTWRTERLFETIRSGTFVIVLSGCLNQNQIIEPVLVESSVVSGKVDIASIEWKFLERMANVRERHEFQKDENHSIFSPEDARAIFGLFCQGGKPARAVEHSVDYVMPRPQAGVALDEATKSQEHDQLTMNRQIAVFYLTMINPVFYDRALGRDLSKQDLGGQPRGHPWLFIPDRASWAAKIRSIVSGKSQSDRKAYVELLKNLRSDDQVEKIPIVIGSHERNVPWIMSHVKLSTDRRSSASEFFRSYTYHYSSGEQFTRNDIPPTGLVELVPLELLAISGHFTLVVSRGESESWANLALDRQLGKLDTSASQRIQQHGGMLPQSELLRHRRKIFEDYLVANTSIKQSATEDGQIFTFSLSLNTEPLCRAARPTDSLLSK